MTYYLAEIRFNRNGTSSKSEKRMKKPKLTHLLTLVSISLLVLIGFLTVPTALSSTQSDVIESLDRLSDDILVLPGDAFKNPRTMNAHKRALSNKINAVINQIETGAFGGALNKLENDVRKSIIGWIEPAYAEGLVALVDEIIDLIRGVTPPVPDFSIEARPALLTIEQGGADKSTIIIESLNGFSQPIDLKVTSSLIDGILTTIDPVEVTPPPDGSATSALTVEVASTVIPTTYTITVSGTYISLEHSKNITLAVTPPQPIANFSVEAHPASLTIQQGGSNASVVTVTSLEGFSQPVNLTVTSEPTPEITATLDPSRVIPPPDESGISVLTVYVASIATVGSYNVTVNGVSNTLQHSTEILLEIIAPPAPPFPDFSVAAFPTSLSVKTGHSVTSTIAVISLRDFSEPVDLTIPSEPISDVTLTVYPAGVIPPPNAFVVSILTVDVDVYASPGDYQITVVGTSGLLEHSVDIRLEIAVESTPPQIVSVFKIPEEPTYNASVTVYAAVADAESDVKEVLLSHSGSGNWKNSTMALKEEGLYRASIPTFPFDTRIEYRIYASDNFGNMAFSSVYSYTVGDPYPPQISMLYWEPEEPDPEVDVIVNVTVMEPADGSGVEDVVLRYNATDEWQPLEMTLTNGNWTATIPGQSGDSTVAFYVEAHDKAGNSVTTSIYEYEVKLPPWPLAWLAGITLGVAALTVAGTYGLHRRKRKNQQESTPRISRISLVFSSCAGRSIDWDGVKP